MKINIVMNFFSGRATGGVKIIFQYANHFAENGHDVMLVYGIEEPLAKYKGKIPYFMRIPLQSLRVKAGASWFKLNKKIKKIAVRSVNNDSVPDGDIVFATAVETAQWVAGLSDDKGKKFYLIQGFENWNFSDKAVYDTYRLGMTNIAIAGWLEELVQKYDRGRTILIPNAIDTNVFHVITPPEQRKPHSISMIYQQGECKGFEYGMDALIKLRNKYPDMQCKIFGVTESDENWPEWIEYVHRASESQLADIYNSSAVFMCSSVIEGFGLCGAESMACGCALVSSGYQGVFTYANPDETALITEVKDSEALFQAVSRLFDDTETRVQLAKNGNRAIKKLSWTNAYRKMDELLMGALEETGKPANTREDSICKKLQY